jgi:hypothetical protein
VSRKLFALALLTACASSPPTKRGMSIETTRDGVVQEPSATGPSDDQADRAMADLARLMEDQATAAAAGEGDCDKAAAGARAIWERDQEQVKALVTLPQPTSAQVEELNRRYGARVRAAAEKLAAVDAQCRDNAAWKELQDSMRGKPRKDEPKAP